MKNRQWISVWLVVALLVSACFGSVAAEALQEEANAEFSPEKILYFNDFEKAEDLIVTSSGTGADGSITSEITVSSEDSATMVWRQSGTSATVKTLISNFPTVRYTAGSSETLPDIALEYRVRLNLYSKEKNFGSVFQMNRGVGVNAVYLLGSGTSNNNIYKNGNSRQDDLGKWPEEQWVTFTILYSGTEDRRDIYMDGTLLATALPTDESGKEENSAYTNIWKQTKTLPLSIFFQGNSNTYFEMDYLKVYTPAKTLDFTVQNAETTDTDSFQIQFNAAIQNLSAQQITVDGVSAKNIVLTDRENNVYTVIPETSLQPASNHEVSVDGAADLFGNTLNKTCAFHTRAAQMVSFLPSIGLADDELTALVSGTAVLHAAFRNEQSEQGNAMIWAVQYDAGGRMTDNLYRKEITVPANEAVEVDETLEVSDTASMLQAFVWEGAKRPIPISGLKQYHPNGVEKIEYDRLLPDTTDELSLSVALREDYSGLSLSLGLPEGKKDRFVGILVQDQEENVIYVSQAKTVDGKAEFGVPMDESNVGQYTVIAGVQNGGIASDTIDYYSPNYVAKMLAEKVNAETADTESVADFTALFGEYLNMDTEGLMQVQNRERVYQLLLNMRNAQENKIFENHEQLISSFAVAVKMEKIYEGINAVQLIGESSDLQIDATILQIWNNDLSENAAAYAAAMLKEKDYLLPSELAMAVKTYAILGGVYRADSYKQVRKLIKCFGQEIGVDMASYQKLSSPEKVDQKVRGVAFASLDAFAAEVNRRIAEVKKAENTSSSGNSGHGSSGNSGIGSIGLPAKPTATPTPSQNPTPPPHESLSFDDVKATDWFYSDVMWAAEKGLFIGTAKGEFTPDAHLTWEQITIVLGRMGFAFQNEHGQENISRGDFAGLLFRFLAEKQENDSAQAWAEREKVFIGNENGDMLFDNTLTRAECCTVLRRIEK